MGAGRAAQFAQARELIATEAHERNRDPERIMFNTIQRIAEMFASKEAMTPEGVMRGAVKQGLVDNAVAQEFIDSLKDLTAATKANTKQPQANINGHNE